jgi:hypothetical protein
MVSDMLLPREDNYLAVWQGIVEDLDLLLVYLRAAAAYQEQCGDIQLLEAVGLEAVG